MGKPYSQDLRERVIAAGLKKIVLRFLGRRT